LIVLSPQAVAVRGVAARMGAVVGWRMVGAWR
jgi:hypothetical protein